MNSRRFLLVTAIAVLITRVAHGSEPQRFFLKIARGKLVEGPKVIRLKRDAAVELNVLSEVADELHVHGYNLTLKLSPNMVSTLRFAAKLTGRFTFEMHKTHWEVGAFEIYPD